METYLKNQQLKQFHSHSQSLLTDSENSVLRKVLKDYQSTREIDRLVQGVRIILNTQLKQELLIDIRGLIPLIHLEEFDFLINFNHDKFGERLNKNEKRISPEIVHPYNRNHVEAQKNIMKENNYNEIKSKKEYDEEKVKKREQKPQSEMAPNLHAKPKAASLPDTVSYVPSIGEVLLINVNSVDRLHGFSIRGGLEVNLGIYVSHVTRRTPSDEAGLEVGDKILEVNNISFERIANPTAHEILAARNQLKMIVKRVGKVPEWKFAKQKISWYDVNEQKVIKGKLVDMGSNPDLRALPKEPSQERKINMKMTKKGGTMGFNVRGGGEYGLGIYVSNVDKGSVAAGKGLQVGDEIITANGKLMSKLTHTAAVDYLKRQKYLSLTVKSVGRYPAYQRLYTEYTWSGTSTGYKSRSSSAPSSVLTDSWGTAERLLRQLPMETKIDKMARLDSQSDYYSMGEQAEALPSQSEIIIPQDSDVTFLNRVQSDSEYSAMASGESMPNSSIADKLLQESLRQNASDFSSEEETYTHFQKPFGNSSTKVNPIFQPDEVDNQRDVNKGKHKGAAQDQHNKDSRQIPVKIRDNDSKHYRAPPGLKESRRMSQDLSRSKEIHTLAAKGQSDAQMVRRKMDVLQDSRINQDHTSPRNKHKTKARKDANQANKKQGMEQEIRGLNNIEEASIDSGWDVTKGDRGAADGGEYEVKKSRHNSSGTNSLSIKADVHVAPTPTSVEKQENSKPTRSNRVDSEHSPEKIKESENVKEINKSAASLTASSPGNKNLPDANSGRDMSALSRIRGPYFHTSSSDEYEAPVKVKEKKKRQKRKQSVDEFLPPPSTFWRRKSQFMADQHLGMEDVNKEGSQVVEDKSDQSETVYPAITVDINAETETDKQNDSRNDSGSGQPEQVETPVVEKQDEAMLLPEYAHKKKPSVVQRFEERMLLGGSHAHSNSPGSISRCGTPLNNVRGMSRNPTPEDHSVLSEDEITTLSEYIEVYEQDKDIKALVEKLLKLLDAPEKVLVLREVRKTIDSEHMSLFDTLVSSAEIKANQDLLNKRTSTPSKKKNLMVPVLDEATGRFVLKTVVQEVKDVSTQQKVISMLQGRTKNAKSAWGRLSFARLKQFSLKEERWEDVDHGDRKMTLFLQKNKDTLGLSISGGKDSKLQPDVRVDKIIPGGCAADNKNLKVGMTILFLDGEDLSKMSHKDAVGFIRRTFHSRQKTFVKLIVKKKNNPKQ